MYNIWRHSADLHNYKTKIDESQFNRISPNSSMVVTVLWNSWPSRIMEYLPSWEKSTTVLPSRGVAKVPASKMKSRSLWIDAKSSTHNELGSPLTFALVKASGSSNAFTRGVKRSLSMTLIPIDSTPGFNSGFKVSFLGSTAVTGPGNNLCNTMLISSETSAYWDTWLTEETKIAIGLRTSRLLME